MRYVVFGAGAVGGVVGHRLAAGGQDVVLVARGEHAEAMRRDGLRLRGPEEDATLAIPVATAAAEVDWRPDDVVLLAVKSQQTEPALADLTAAAPPDTPIVCLQNGVDNERAALRRFARVYGVPVLLPAGHLEPGVVESYSAPVTGILDVGRYPEGVDEVTQAVAAAFSACTFVSEPRPDVMRWKWSKLLANLTNAVEALCGRSARFGDLARAARREGARCLAAAGVGAASREEDEARRGDLLVFRDIDGEARPGGSTWQSLARGTGDIEVDYLNGEIVLLGRLHGFPTPVNEALLRLANEASRARRPPGSMTEEELLARLPPGVLDPTPRSVG